MKSAVVVPLRNMASLANLSSLVNAKYLEAKVHEGLIFSPTRVAVIKAAGFPVRGYLLSLGRICFSDLALVSAEVLSFFVQ